MNEKLILKKHAERNLCPQKSDMKIEINNSSKGFISVTVSTAQLFCKLIEKAQPYITNTCMDWLTDFGKNTIPDHFPHSTQIEVNQLYNREEVFLFLLKEFDQECALTTNIDIVEPLFIPYASHTSVEMVSILKSIYRTVAGDEYLFMKKITRSEDIRLKSMNPFAVDVLYQFVKEIIDLEDR